MIDVLPRTSTLQRPGGGEKDYPMCFDFCLMGSKPFTSGAWYMDHLTQFSHMLKVEMAF